MVLILDGNSEIGAHAWSDISDLFNLTYLDRRQWSQIRNYFHKGRFPQHMFSVLWATI